MAQLTRHDGVAVAIAQRLHRVGVAVIPGRVVGDADVLERTGLLQLIERPVGRAHEPFVFVVIEQGREDAGRMETGIRSQVGEELVARPFLRHSVLLG